MDTDSFQEGEEEEPRAQYYDDVTIEKESAQPTQEQELMRAKWYEDLEGYYRDQQIPENWSSKQHARFKRLARDFR